MRATLYGEFTVEINPYAGAIFGSFEHDQAAEQAQLRAVHEYLLELPNAVLVDVGANTGSYSLLTAHHPTMAAHAFEPCPLPYTLLEEHIRLNHLETRVIPWNLALADYNGSGTFYVAEPDSCTALSMLGGKPAESKRFHEISVGVRTLDSFGLARVDVLKIDVEGGELAVLRGAEETLKRRRPLVVFEHQGANTLQYGYGPFDLWKLLEAWDYQVEMLSAVDGIARPREVLHEPS